MGEAFLVRRFSGGGIYVLPQKAPVGRMKLV